MRQVWEQNCLFGSSCVVGVEQAGGVRVLMVAMHATGGTQAMVVTSQIKH